MGQDLHTIDRLFKNAHEGFEDEPSSSVWEQINYKLDHGYNDAATEQIRSFSWRKMLFLLLFLSVTLSLDKFHKAIFNVSHGKTGIIYNPHTTKSGKTKDMDPEETRVKAGSPQEISLQENRDKIISGKYSSTDRLKYYQDNKQGITKENSIKSKPSVFSFPENSDSIKQENTSTDSFVSTAERLHSVPGKIYVYATDPVDIILNKGKLIKGRVIESISYLKKGDHFLFNRQKRWSLTFSVSSDWGGYFINDEKLDRSGIPHDEHDEISGREHHEKSYSAAIFFSRYFPNRFLVKAGIMYSNTAIGINPQYIYASKEPDGTIGYKYITSSGYDFVKPSFGNPAVIGDSLYSAEAEHSLKSIGLLIMPGYTFRHKKLSVSPSAGFSLNYIAEATLQTEVEDNLNSEMISVDRLAGTRKFYLGFVTDISVGYAFNKQWSLNFIPSFRANVTPVTKTDFIKTYPYSFSLGAGLSYSF